MMPVQSQTESHAAVTVADRFTRLFNLQSEIIDEGRRIAPEVTAKVLLAQFRQATLRLIATVRRLRRLYPRKNAPNSPPADPAALKKLKHQLIDSGLTATALARQFGCSRPAIYQALSGKACCGIRQKIDEVLRSKAAPA